MLRVQLPKCAKQFSSSLSKERKYFTSDNILFKKEDYEGMLYLGNNISVCLFLVL